MTTPDVSVVIVNYNAGVELTRALESIAEDLGGQALGGGRRRQRLIRRQLGGGRAVCSARRVCSGTNRTWVSRAA